MKRIIYIVLVLLVFMLNGYKVQATTEATLMDSLDAYGFNEAQQELIHTEVNAYTEVIAKESGGNMDAFKAKMKDFFNKLRDGFRVYQLARQPSLEKRIAEFDALETGVQIHVLTYVEGAFMNNIFQRLAEMYYNIQNPEKHVKLKYKLKQAPSYTAEQPLFAPIASVLFSPAVIKLLTGKQTELQAMQVASNVFATASSYNILLDKIQEDISLSVDAELDILGQKLDREIASSSQLEMLSKYTDLSMKHTFDHIAAATVRNNDNLMFILPSCQFAELTVSGVSNLKFLNGKKLVRFTYQGDVYSFSYTPSIQTDATGKPTDGGSLPNMQGRFLPFEKMEQAIETEKQLPDVYNARNQFRYTVKKGETIFYEIGSRWLFSGITLTECTNDGILAEGNTLVPIKDCAAYIKQCEAEGESSAGNGSAYSSGSVTIIDYTKDAAGVSLVNPEEIRSIGLSTTEWNDKIGFKAKIYLLCKQDKNFQTHFAEANQDASPGRIIIVIDGTKENHSIDLQHRFKIPDWISTVLPAGNSYSNSNNCISEYINTGLTALHNSSGYKGAPLFLQIKQEYGLALYRGLFGMLYCLTNEQSVAGKGATMKFVAGGLNELISDVDLVQMVEGLAQIAKGAASNVIEAHVNFVLDQKQTFDDLKNGRPIPPVELVSRMVPPPLRMQAALISTAANVSADLVKFYFTECESEQEFGSNMCPYRYGQVTVLVIPVVLTAGEWAFVKSGQMLSRLKTFKGIKKADEVAEILKKGGETEVTAGKIIVNDGEEITTIEKVEDDVVIRKNSLANSLKKLINKASSESILWKNLDETNIIWSNPNNNILSTAKSFANETGASLYDIVLSNDYYVKFDLNDGRILLGNTNGNYHAFAVLNDADLGAFKASILNVTDDVFNAKLSQLLAANADKLKIFSGIASKQLTIAGKIITLSKTKINTMLGRFNPDVGNLFKELGDYKNVGLGENVGGINLLNKPNFYEYLSPESWWNRYNKNWLERAVNRGDDIYLATIHTNKADILDVIGNPKGAFGYELRYLVQRGYKPKNISGELWETYKLWFK